MNYSEKEYTAPLIDVIETDIETATLLQGSFRGEDSEVEQLISMNYEVD